MVPEGAKMAPEWFQRVPRWPEMAPRRPQDCPKRAPSGPRWPQDVPRWPQDGPKMAPRRPQDDPRRPKPCLRYVVSSFRFPIVVGSSLVDTIWDQDWPTWSHLGGYGRHGPVKRAILGVKNDTSKIIQIHCRKWGLRNMRLQDGAKIAPQSALF